MFGPVKMGYSGNSSSGIPQDANARPDVDLLGQPLCRRPPRDNAKENGFMGLGRAGVSGEGRWPSLAFLTLSLIFILAEANMESVKGGSLPAELAVLATENLTKPQAEQKGNKLFIFLPRIFLPRFLVFWVFARFPILAEQ